MFGVVLWSDQAAGKAVIWCEDHGDLAFYSSAAHTGADGGLTGTDLDAGDLVEFEVQDERDLRLATNPQVISERLYSGLAERLSGAQSGPALADAADSAGIITLHQGSARIVPFRPREAGPVRAEDMRIVGKGL
jgi:hypothetical protein